MSRFVYRGLKTRSDVQAEALLGGVAASEPALAALLEQIRELVHTRAPLPAGDLALLLEHGLPLQGAVTDEDSSPLPGRAAAGGRPVRAGRWTARVGAGVSPLAMKIAFAAAATAATGALAAADALPTPLQRAVDRAGALFSIEAPESADDPRVGEESPSASRSGHVVTPGGAGPSGLVHDGAATSGDGGHPAGDRSRRGPTDEGDERREEKKDRRDDGREEVGDARDDADAEEKDRAAEDDREEAEDRVEDDREEAADRVEDDREEAADRVEDDGEEAEDRVEDDGEEAEDRVEDDREEADDEVDD